MHFRSACYRCVNVSGPVKAVLTCALVDLISQRAFALLNTLNPSDPWFLDTVNQHLRLWIWTSGNTYNCEHPSSSPKSRRSAMLLLSSVSSSRGCNRYGFMTPQRHARPSTKQRLQTRILKSAADPLGSSSLSHMQELVQQKAVWNNSPPQNEQLEDAVVGSIRGNRSSCGQRL